MPYIWLHKQFSVMKQKLWLLVVKNQCHKAHTICNCVTVKKWGMPS
ncbi:Uncharacterised protein [Mycobacteroides abscessus subsp. abscessus]|nr:Uncharacterised protein [Mycobacteroides abscessus subsp. abscessus]